MLAALVLATALDSAMAAPPAPADSTPPPEPRVVTRLQEFVVRGSALHDPFSSQTARVLPKRVLQSLPLDRVTALIALQAGVVARGEDLHVRGGRSGERVTLIQGIELEEPLRGLAPEIPLIAIREAELVSGGQDADHGGALAGVLHLRTVDPGERWGGEALWQTDGRTGTHYDRAAVRVGGPIPRLGLGVVLSAEAMLDDAGLPALRTPSRTHFLGGSFGWRADNRLSGHLKLATPDPASRVTFEVLTSRRVDRPFDPMWSLDGWTTRCVDPWDLCARGPSFSAEPVPGWERYRAADHKTITDDRRFASILSWQSATAQRRFAVALAWLRARAITSLNGLDDESHLAPERAPELGRANLPTSDPFYIYAGDEPFFRRTESDAITVRGDLQRTNSSGSLFKVGVGARYDAVEKREIDFTIHGGLIDSLRAFRAFAPSGFAYAQGRWVFEGMIAHLGVRAEYFTPGPQAADQSSPGQDRGMISVSPRFGVAYPVSVRDVFSLSYVRLQQKPRMDYLYDNRDRITNRQPLGNPSLVPSTAVSWQAALKHLFPPLWSLQVSLFYRDLYGLVGARNTRPELAEPLLRYENVDDAHAFGTEFTLIRVAGETSRLQMDYTWQVARGSYSSEDGVPYGPLLRRRPESVGEHPLDWDRRHTIALSGFWQAPHDLLVSWSAAVGSPLPWTPALPRTEASDLSLENSRRLGWEETTNVALRWRVPGTRDHLTMGLDVHNLFGRRNEVATRVDGYPQPLINTYYDDYSAYRAETGRGGGGYYDDADQDGLPDWVPVNDPRLFSPPRSIRMSLAAGW